MPNSTELLEQHCTRHFSDDFCRVTPTGARLMSKPQLVLGLTNAHGTYPKDFEIHIHNVQVLVHVSHVIKLVHYEEWQRMGGGKTTARRTTALLQLKSLGLLRQPRSRGIRQDDSDDHETHETHQTHVPTTDDTDIHTHSSTCTHDHAANTTKNTGIHSDTSIIQWRSVHETWIEGKGPQDNFYAPPSIWKATKFAPAAPTPTPTPTAARRSIAIPNPITSSSNKSTSTSTSASATTSALQSLSLISPRRHISDQLSVIAPDAVPVIMDSSSSSSNTTFTNSDGNGDGDGDDGGELPPVVTVGLNLKGITIQTLQGPMANEVWLDRTTEQLRGLCQFNNENHHDDDSRTIATTTTTATLINHDESHFDNDADNECRRHRRITLPEVCFPHAVVKVTLGGDQDSGDATTTTTTTTTTSNMNRGSSSSSNSNSSTRSPTRMTLLWDCHKALEAWSRAHAGIPVGSSVEHDGVSVRKTVDAALWSHKTIPNTDFHFDWTYMTPFSVAVVVDNGDDDHDDGASDNGDGVTANPSITTTWMELPKSGLNLKLLQDTSQPILFFDDIELYEDDLHDNGVVNFRVKVRLMPTCLYVLSRCWCRVDNAELICRETRTMVEFGTRTSNTTSTSTTAKQQGRQHSHAVYRDITWRQCAWSDLAGVYNLPTDVRAWKNEGGGTETAAWNALVNRLPIVDLPPGMPRYSMLQVVEQEGEGEQQRQELPASDDVNGSVSMQVE